MNRRIMFGFCFYFIGLAAVFFSRPPFSTAIAEVLVISFITLVIFGRKAMETRP